MQNSSDSLENRVKVSELDRHVPCQHAASGAEEASEGAPRCRRQYDSEPAA
jgi:hypothetical protein